MVECKICNLIKSGKLKKVYEDEKVLAALSPEPVSQGHVWILPKKHHPIIEQIPDYDIGSLFEVANKISISLFEALQVQGTNIFVQNGVAAGQTYSHFIINIVPRMPEDGINLEWQPKQLTEEEMSTVELKIKDQVGVVGQFEEETPEPVNLDKKKETLKESSTEEDYLVKSLRRIP